MSKVPLGISILISLLGVFSHSAFADSVLPRPVALVAVGADEYSPFDGYVDNPLTRLQIDCAEFKLHPDDVFAVNGEAANANFYFSGSGMTRSSGMDFCAQALPVPIIIVPESSSAAFLAAGIVGLLIVGIRIRRSSYLRSSDKH
jgi:hypothetical protein